MYPPFPLSLYIKSWIRATVFNWLYASANLFLVFWWAQCMSPLLTSNFTSYLRREIKIGRKGAWVFSWTILTFWASNYHWVISSVLLLNDMFKDEAYKLYLPFFNLILRKLLKTNFLFQNTSANDFIFYKKSNLLSSSYWDESCI